MTGVTPSGDMPYVARYQVAAITPKFDQYDQQADDEAAALNAARAMLSWSFPQVTITRNEYDGSFSLRHLVLHASGVLDSGWTKFPPRG